MKSIVALFAIVLGMPAQAYFGAPGTEVVVPKSKSGGSPYGFIEYLPAGYSDAAGAAKVPLIIFLHGVDEKGDGENNPDLNNYLNTGLAKSIAGGFIKPQGIVLSPQTPVWWNADTINLFVDYAFSKYKNADVNRLYVTGLSMGGAGTWEYVSKYGSRVAATVPICGAKSFDQSKLYGKGVWAFHAFNDTRVSKGYTINNVNSVTPPETNIMTGYPYVNGGAASTHMTALFSHNTQTHQWISGESVGDQSHDKLVRFTMYKDGGHTIWSRAYANKDMWAWLYTWTNNGAPVPAPSPTPKPSPSATPKPSPSATPVPTGAVAFTSGVVDIDFGLLSNGSLVANRVGDALAHGGQLNQLVKQDKVKTTAGLSIVQGFNGLNTNGTTAPSSTIGFDAGATSDSFYGNDVSFGGTVAPTVTLAIVGLDPTRRYDLKFFASRMSSGGDIRETKYSASGVNSGSVLLNASENTSKVGLIAGIQPSANGSITIDLSKGPNNNNHYGFFYLGAMSIAAKAVVVPPQEIRVDFGSNALALPAGWNNGRGLVQSGSLALKTSSGASAAASLVTLSRFNSVNSAGTTAAASALNLPAATTQDSFFGNDVSFNGVIAPKAVMELRGLDPAKTYNLEFFASRLATDGLNRSSAYRAIGATNVVTSLNATNNTSVSAKLSLKPNASGVIRLEMYKGASNNTAQGFYYLGNLRIKF